MTRPTASLSSVKNSSKLFYGRHWIGDEEYEAVLEVLKHGFLTTGPQVAAFEEEVRDYAGAKHAIAVSSCTAALHLSLLAHGIGPGDEVITTVYSFVATANAILHCGARPVFADIEEGTYNLDPAAIPSKITSKTKAILPVHFTGQPCRMKEIRALAGKHGLAVIEDASHAIGASDAEEGKIGRVSDAACFSFHPVKNMTTAEGGMIATHSGKVARLCRAMRLHGIVDDYYDREKTGDLSYPLMTYLGYKYNMTDVQAALGRCQLKKLDFFTWRRQAMAAQYLAALEKRGELRMPQVRPAIGHAWHLFVIRLNLETVKVTRDQWMNKLAEKGIMTGVHYLPVHLHPYYRETFGYRLGDFPAAEAVYQSLVSIPMYPKMSDEDVKRVISAIEETLDEARN